MRLFCLTVHFYSPKAYEYIRSYFNFNLPNIRTIRNWYSAINTSPGFTEGSFDVLRQKADEARADGESLKVCLIHDDMSIRQHSQWNEEKFLGHINAGKPENHNLPFSPLAKQANVLMVKGIGKPFKVPIGYFLIDGLTADERAAIIYEALFMLNDINIDVCAITNDGHVSNIATSKILGADFNADKPYFKNPFDKKKVVYMILDPPHMIKLARNCLGNKETIYDSENKEIKWSFFEKLVTLQSSENLHFGNKLTKSHLEFEKIKMNVRIAAETLSNSTAESMEYLNKVLRHEDFQNSESTVDYIRVFNNLFDIMNSKENHCDNKYKQPISETTINQIITYFELARKYIQGLQIIENGKKKPILQSRSFTPYFGFYHNMISFKQIYHDYIKNSSINEFYTYDVSQDHLEMFFGCIRRMGGSVFIWFFKFRFLSIINLPFFLRL